MTITYTARAVRDLPYPPGLGKQDWPELQTAISQELGEGSFADVEANRRQFWTGGYQTAIATHLAPDFDRVGDIVEVARRALAIARLSAAFDRPLPSEASTASAIYAADFPSVSVAREATEREIYEWLRDPPTLSRNESGEVRIIDGRHRMSYLRSRIEWEDPTFPVLVRIIEPTLLRH